MNLSSEEQLLDLPAVDKMDDKGDQEEPCECSQNENNLSLYLLFNIVTIIYSNNLSFSHYNCCCYVLVRPCL